MIAKRAGPSLILIGVLLIGFTALLVDASHGIFDSEAFADRAASSLKDPRVSEYVANKITDGIISARPNLIALRPLIVGTMGGLVQSAPFRALARKALATAQASAFSKGSEQVLLSVPDVGILLRSALAGVGPEVAAKIPDKLESAVGGLERNRLGHILGRLRTLWSRVQWLSRVLIILAPLLVLTGIYLYTDRRRGLVRAGTDLAVVGFGLALLVPLGRLVAWYLVPQDEAARNAVFGLWRAYFMGLFTWASTLAGIGVVLAAAGTSLYEGVDPFTRIRGLAGAALEPPASRGGRALWALALATAGTIILIWPTSVVAGVAILAGALLIYAALRELFRLIIERMPEQVSEAEAASGSARRLLAIVGLTAIIIAVILVFRRPTAAPPVVTAISSCNGSPLLCDRRVDEVVFPASHNAMSNARAEGWMFPHHAKAMPEMLEDGVRALLIDIHYGIATSERVKTDMDKEKASLDKIQKAVGPEGYAAAMRIRDRLVVGEGSKSELYFCHGFCELGAYKVGPTLSAIRDFMVSHPDQVIILVIEDYVSPGELKQAFDEAGLTELVYTGSVSPPWPTLRQLIDQNQRIIVFLESGNPGVPWMHGTQGTIQETPYTFHKIEDFTCRPNRGGTEGSLFQINHWIETTPAPKPTNAAIVNAYDFLLGRARQCQKERKHLPNIIAVDFYGTGDLLRVAATLNGLPDSTVSGKQ